MWESFISAKLLIILAYFHWSIISTSESYRNDVLILKGQASLPVDHINEIRHGGKQPLLVLAEITLLIKCPSEALHKWSHTSVLIIIASLFLTLNLWFCRTQIHLVFFSFLMIQNLEKNIILFQIIILHTWSYINI